LGKPNYPIPKGQSILLIAVHQAITDYKRLKPFQKGMGFLSRWYTEENKKVTWCLDFMFGNELLKALGNPTIPFPRGNLSL
jgi:hypothetical protein